MRVNNVPLDGWLKGAGRHGFVPTPQGWVKHASGLPWLNLRLALMLLQQRPSHPYLSRYIWVQTCCTFLLRVQPTAQAFSPPPYRLSPLPPAREMTPTVWCLKDSILSSMPSKSQPLVRPAPWLRLLNFRGIQISMTHMRLQMRVNVRQSNGGPKKLLQTLSGIIFFGDCRAFV
jgi:hypothetical protein